MLNFHNKRIIITNLTVATGKDEAASVFLNCQIWQNRHLSREIVILSNRWFIKELIWPLNKK